MQSHDLSLPAWGPYTKRYSGISHVPAANDGVRFDLSVFPGMYRRRVDVPNVRFESGFHPWAAAPDLSCYVPPRAPVEGSAVCRHLFAPWGGCPADPC